MTKSGYDDKQYGVCPQVIVLHKLYQVTVNVQYEVYDELDKVHVRMMVFCVSAAKIMKICNPASSSGKVSGATVIV